MCSTAGVQTEAVAVTATAGHECWGMKGGQGRAGHCSRARARMQPDMQDLSHMTVT